MPSDRLDMIRDRLASRAAPYAEAALLAAEEVDALLRIARVPSQGGVPAFAAALGPLGAAHFDTDRLAPLFDATGRQSGLSGPDLQVLDRAASVLREVSGARGPGHLELPPGTDLVTAVRNALGRSGRAFGAAHAVALVRSGRFDPALHAEWLDRYPFARWTRRERQITPPLVVSLDGADLKPSGLAEFLDGGLVLVLVVRDGTAPPAALIRLVSPGVFVAQILDGESFPAFDGLNGPAVVAWVPAGAAAFVHDPSDSPALGARFRILADAVPPRRGLGGLSAAQLADELRQLEAMAGLATAPAGAVTPGDSSHPVDRLAAWILTQADLTAPTPAP